MQLTNPGRYRATPLSWTIEQKPSGAVIVTVLWSVFEVWSGAEWLTMHEPETIYSYTAVVKRDRTPNTTGIEQLARSGLWNGEVGEFANPPRATLVVILKVHHDSYRGVTRAKVDWISPDDEVPPGPGLHPPSRELLQSAKEQFGDALRSVISRTTSS